MKFVDPNEVLGSPEPSRDEVEADLNNSISFLLATVDQLRRFRQNLQSGCVGPGESYLSFASVDQNGWDVTGPSYIRTEAT
jgi:hypothetical protein